VIASASAYVTNRVTTTRPHVLDEVFESVTTSAVACADTPAHTDPMIHEDDDLAVLRERFPGWQISAQWAAAATGPDARVLHATSGTRTLTARTAAALAAQIEQAGPGGRGRSPR
jgi:hypothetical protein